MLRLGPKYTTVQWQPAKAPNDKFLNLARPSVQASVWVMICLIQGCPKRLALSSENCTNSCTNSHLYWLILATLFVPPCIRHIIPQSHIQLASYVGSNLLAGPSLLPPLLPMSTSLPLFPAPDLRSLPSPPSLPLLSPSTAVSFSGDWHRVTLPPLPSLPPMKLGSYPARILTLSSGFVHIFDFFEWKVVNGYILFSQVFESIKGEVAWLGW